MGSIVHNLEISPRPYTFHSWMISIPFLSTHPSITVRRRQKLKHHQELTRPLPRLSVARSYATPCHAMPYLQRHASPFRLPSRYTVSPSPSFLQPSVLQPVLSPVLHFPALISPALPFPLLAQSKRPNPMRSVVVVVAYECSAYGLC